MRRVFMAVIVVGLLAGISYIGYQRSRAGDTAAVSGEQVEVRRGTISATVSATGSVEPEREVTLTFSTVGKVVEIPVEEGQMVEAGAVIARLETDDLELAVAQAEAALAAAQARQRQLQNPATEGDIAAAEAFLASAQANLQRVREGPQASEVEAARARLQAAQEALNTLLAGPNEAELIAAQAALARAEAAVKQAQAAYDEVAWREDIAMLPQALQLEQATIDYEQAKANYNEVIAGPRQDQIDQARAQVAEAQAQLDALLRGATAADIAAAEAQVVEAQTQLDKLRTGATENEIAAAEADVRQAEVALEQARINLERATLTAPFAGTVARIGVREAELVSQQTPVATLVDLSAFHLEVAIDEIDVGQVQVGAGVTVTLDAFRDQPFTGVIERVAPVPEIDQGVVTYPVRIRLDAESAPGVLRSGLTANATIITERHEDALLVPNRAVEIDRATGDSYVQKLDPRTGQTVRTTVVIGLRDEQYSEVLSGLEEGDIVVIPESGTTGGLFGARNE